MRGGQLHLTPVRRLLQMRPSLTHLDAADERDLHEMVALRLPAFKFFFPLFFVGSQAVMVLRLFLV